MANITNSDGEDYLSLELCYLINAPLSTIAAQQDPFCERETWTVAD